MEAIMLEELEKLLHKYFDVPFLPEGFVVVKRVDDIYGKPALSIWIGDRDVTVFEDWTSPGSGTSSGDAVRWKIALKNKCAGGV